MTDEPGIFIGNKPFMNYVTGVVMQFTKGADQVVVKARGKFISRAVDVAEVATKRFLLGQAEIKDIRVDSDDLENREGRKVQVSSIEISLGRKI
jgi:DNA-binding protein